MRQKGRTQNKCKQAWKLTKLLRHQGLRNSAFVFWRDWEFSSRKERILSNIGRSIQVRRETEKSCKEEGKSVYEEGLTNTPISWPSRPREATIQRKKQKCRQTTRERMELRPRSTRRNSTCHENHLKRANIRSRKGSVSPSQHFSN